MRVRDLFLNYRDDTRCREKWCNSLDPSLRGGSFTPEEDALLKKLLEKYGPGNWADKAVWFPGRTDAQLMSRWRSRSLTGE